MHLAFLDVPEADIIDKFEEAIAFINNHRRAGRAVLVYSKLGISRAATIIIAFLMKEKGLAMRVAFNWVVQCRPQICPNRGFMSQLDRWEAILNASRAEGVTASNVNEDDADETAAKYLVERQHD